MPFIASITGDNPLLWFALTVGQILLITVVLLLVVAFMIYGDRKVFAGVQMRKGPNVVGPFGLLQSFADLGKFLAIHEPFRLAPFPVTEFVLFSSRLGSDHAAYTAEVRYPLI